MATTSQRNVRQYWTEFNQIVCLVGHQGQYFYTEKPSVLPVQMFDKHFLYYLPNIERNMVIKEF